MGLRYYVTGRNIRLNKLNDRRIQAQSRCGQTLVEYGLILAFISVVAIAALMAMGGQTSTTFGTVTSQLNVASGGGTASSGSGSGSGSGSSSSRSSRTTN